MGGRNSKIIARMCLRKLLIGLFCLPLFAQGGPTLTPAETEARDDGAAKLQALIEASPKLPLEQTDLVIKLPKGQELGMVSWLARDPNIGVTWLIQRGDKADPVLAVDKEGRVLRSFGKGLYKIPHAIQLDPEGNVWTVDAGSSTVIKFSPKGKKLLEIDVGGQPEPAISAFRGSTDIAFAPKGRIFISDGYANARILEYTADGKKVREWGSAGAGPGQFHLPHSIVADEDNILYVADRENGRIEKFDLDGKFLGEISNLGRTYSLKLGTNGTIWAGMQPMNELPGSPGWVVKLDRKTGKILGYVPVSEKAGLHSVEDAGEGQPMTAVGNKVVWFKRHSLGSAQ
jgi:DNA-binding beta-propeller fold protein YncE